MHSLSLTTSLFNLNRLIFYKCCCCGNIKVYCTNKSVLETQERTIWFKPIGQTFKFLDIRRMFSGGMDLTFVFVCCPSNNGLRWDGGGQHLDYLRLHLIRQVVSLLSTLLLPPKLGTRDLWTEVVGYY